MPASLEITLHPMQAPIPKRIPERSCGASEWPENTLLYRFNKAQMRLSPGRARTSAAPSKIETHRSHILSLAQITASC
jgi:hypothetical protein